MPPTWVLTKIEDAFGKGPGGTRRAAARNLSVDYDLLSNMGRLASQNDPMLGRKAKGRPKALTENEKAYLRECIVAIAGQVGAHNAGATPSQKSMADLPGIP